MNSAQETDVCIIGSGPSGAATSIMLSKLKVHHYIIDKATFPRDKACGDGLILYAYKSMKLLGEDLFQEFLQSQKFIHSKKIKLHINNKLHIQFKETEDRDMVISYAKRIDFQNIAYPKLMIFGAKITFFMLLIFYFSAYFRLSDNADVEALLIEKTYVYFIGPHESFSTWLSRSHESLFTSYGYNTFTSVFKLLGVSTQQGHYDKFLDSQTNIFLLYRGLLQDFGLILTGVIVIGLSYLANYSDAYLHRLPGLVIAAKASVCMLLFLFISPFTFTE